MVNLNGKTILVTGAAGFIGSFLIKELLKTNNDIKVIGVDSLNAYYDILLKKARLKMLKVFKHRFTFFKADISNRKKMDKIFSQFRPHIVINLAAQAGVRYSISNPDTYIQSNIIGFYTILELCRTYPVEHFIFASSSSVYGNNEKVPYSTTDNVDKPVSLYAATKKTDELLGYAYSKLYSIPVTGLRFFTVYGPMGRPDMAYFKFTDKLVKGEPIQLYNNGDMYRDFTYIDDIIMGVIKIAGNTPVANEDGVSYKIYNIGNNKPESLLYFVETLEKILINENIITKSGKKEFLPMQLGDVYQTYADISELEKDFGFKPVTELKQGLTAFAKWYKEFYLV